jgi:hypothetical protein
VTTQKEQLQGFCKVTDLFEVATLPYAVGQDTSTVLSTAWKAVGDKLMMDAGWDQRASGKVYNSSSGQVVYVGPRTNKVCGLVYYSKR